MGAEVRLKGVKPVPPRPGWALRPRS